MLGSGSLRVKIIKNIRCYQGKITTMYRWKFLSFTWRAYIFICRKCLKLCPFTTEARLVRRARKWLLDTKFDSEELMRNWWNLVTELRLWSPNTVTNLMSSLLRSPDHKKRDQSWKLDSHGSSFRHWRYLFTLHNECSSVFMKGIAFWQFINCDS